MYRCLVTILVILLAAAQSHAALPTSIVERQLAYYEPVAGLGGVCAIYKTRGKNNILSGLLSRGRLATDAGRLPNIVRSISRARDSQTKRTLIIERDRTNRRIAFCKRSAAAILRRAAAGIIADNIIANGVGIRPIIVTFPARSTDRRPLTFSISAGHPDITSRIEGGRVIFTPRSHRLTNAQLRYTARRSDGKSAVRLVTLSWQQGGGWFEGDPTSLATYKQVLDLLEAQHLARWVGLGVDLGGARDLDSIAQRLTSQQSSPSCAAIEQEALEIARTQFVIATRRVTVNGVNVDYSSASAADGRRWWNSRAAAYYMLHLMRYGCEPLRERLALMLLNQFNVNLSSFDGFSERDRYIKNHVDLVRGALPERGSRLLAPFGSMLAQLHGQSGAMLAFLDNRYNAYPYGNENYARETLELFILGDRDAVLNSVNYTEDDVYELSYALMGWTEINRVDDRTSGVLCCDLATNGCTPEIQCITANEKVPAFQNNRWNHPTRPRPSLLFGSFPFGSYDVFKSNTLESGGDNVSSFLLSSHPGVARFLATRLISTFVHGTPDNAAVEELAQVLRSTGYDLAEAMRRVITSSMFFSEEARSGEIGNPVEIAVGFIRALNLPLVRVVSGGTTYDLYSRLIDGLSRAGQYFTNSPSVFGWPEAGKITGGRIHAGDYWATAQSLLERQNLMISYLNDVQNLISRAPTTIAFRWNQLLPSDPALQRDAGAIVDGLAQRLALQLTGEERAMLIEYYTSISLRRQTVGGVVVPVDEYIRTLNLSQMSELEYQNWVTFKVPGLVGLMFGLRGNQLK